MIYKKHFLIGVFLVALLSGCSGGGGNSADPATCVDISGDWDVTSTDDGTACGEGVTVDNNKYTFTQNACTATVVTDVGTFSGSVVGDKISWTGMYPEDGGTTTIDSLELTVAGDKVSGNSAWTWSDGINTCSGTSQISGTKVAPSTVNTPLAPSNLQVTSTSSTSVSLSWSDNSDNESGFVVERSETSSSTGFAAVTTVGTEATNFSNVTGLQPSTTYWYRVKAVNDTGSSDYSNTVSASTSVPAPPQTFTFNGGSLDELKAVSPNLEFFNLNINGTLLIPASVNTVTLTVNDLNINGKIDVDQPTCRPFFDSPNLVISATGTVNVEAPIELNGKGGGRIASGASCNSCNGESGGSVSITASEINVNRSIHTWGGNGSTESDIIGGEVFRFGCSAGSGGDITLNASSSLSIGSNTDFDLDGGRGGSTTNSNGADGTDGIMDWIPSAINVAELVEGGNELNMFTYNAQLVDFETLTLRGKVGLNEEFDHRDDSGSIFVTFDSGFVDYIEDFYLIDKKESGVITLSLTPDNASADLDLYVTDSTATNIKAQSNGASGSESLTTPSLSQGKYLIGVSYADDGLNLTTGYTLQVTK